ncbi:MAG: glycosyltransferase family 2 protein [Hyphomonadaceae bacterium]|nr:glycosyltransferase family 2 protein [Hyphomonadaceae bacterium]
MTLLIVQIPCLNEACTLPQTLADIPRELPGIDKVEVLIIDDGSMDGTAEVALAHGADHVVINPVNKGLAYSFQRGLEACLARGADIIVNTDGDNQYRGADIARLVEPIVNGRADMVIGDRRTAELSHFSPLKKRLQKLGTRMVARMAGVPVRDAVSGFRAFTARTARSLTVRSTFSYTTETLIQAGKKNFTVLSVPVRVNPVERPSRLFRSMPQFLARSGQTMLRVYAMYEPLKLFLWAGVALMGLGLLPVFRFLANYMFGDGSGMVQSLVLGGVLFIMGTLSVMFSLIADLIAYNRQLLELTLERVRAMDDRDQMAAFESLQSAGPSQPAAHFPEQEIRAELDTLLGQQREAG